MLDAVCHFDPDNPVTYTVFRFQKLSELEIELYRQALVCPQCQQKAFYRKASKDGKAACFGSRYHQADCLEFKPSKAKLTEEMHAQEVNCLVADGDSVMIDFSVSGRSQSAEKQLDILAKKADAVPDIDDSLLQADATSKSKLKLSTGESVELAAVQTKADKRIVTEGLEKLLHSLLRGSDLASSDLWVYTDNQYRWRAKNLFVNFADAIPTDNHAPRMYWGTLSHSDKAMQWLNPADCKDVGIPIEGFSSDLLARFNIQERRDLEGAGLIIFGKCFWNKDKTRKIIQLWNKDINCLFISTLD